MKSSHAEIRLSIYLQCKYRELLGKSEEVVVFIPRICNFDLFITAITIELVYELIKKTMPITYTISAKIEIVKHGSLVKSRFNKY